MFWHFLDGESGWVHSVHMTQMIAALHVLFLLFKYRRQVPSLAALSLMMLTYIPVWTYLGWHYTLAGWFVRCAVFWPLIAHLAMRNLSGHWYTIRRHTCHLKSSLNLGETPNTTQPVVRVCGVAIERCN